MADVNQPTVTLTAVGEVDYTVTPHHPTLLLEASGSVDYTFYKTFPSTNMTAAGALIYTVTDPSLALTGAAEITTTTGGSVTVTPPRATPPPGYDTPIKTATFTGVLEITFDRFGRPV